MPKSKMLLYQKYLLDQDVENKTKKKPNEIIYRKSK